MENSVEKVGSRIREIRRSKNETQQQLSVAVGVVQQSVVAWESGRCLPNILSLIRIAGYYEVSADFLLGLAKKRAISRRPYSVGTLACTFIKEQ
ncbi:MAG TPA: helix-turn-helix transcriptional regulator [Negativicutes bacterium]|nr:helix-turn-helix transcriptional regulator [Negativicutes bacterium]